MADKKYRIRYLPLFEQDLVQTVSYITNVLYCLFLYHNFFHKSQ